LSGFSGGNLWVTVPLCPSGDALNLAGRKVHFRIFAVADAGSTAVSTNDEVYPSLLGPSGTGPGVASNFQATRWTTVDLVLPSDGVSYTDMGIAFRITKDGPTTGRWGATFYIDEVTLLP
jgi:hypothetical protein